MTLLLLLLGCGDPGTEAATACEPVECPAGTAMVQSASSSSGFQLDAGLNPSDYSGELAVRTFGEGECSYACETIQSCPDGTWPVLSARCFTCATLNDSGDVVAGTCGIPTPPTDPNTPAGGPCTADADCPWGYTCFDDPLTGGGATCAESCSDQGFGPECKAGFVCDGTNQCVVPECTVDDDCPMGDTCDDGPFGTFMCNSRCTTDQDCKADYTCDAAGACTVPECVTDADCPSGTCSFDECDSQTGCSTAPGPMWAFWLPLALIARRRR